MKLVKVEVRTDKKTKEEKPVTVKDLQKRTPLQIAQDNAESELANLEEQLSNAQTEEEVNELTQKINSLTKSQETLETGGQQQLGLVEEQQKIVPEKNKGTVTAMSLAFKNAELEKQKKVVI